MFSSIHISSLALTAPSISIFVSRASRDRRASAVDASSDAEGYHIDWLFTRHDLGRDLTWGREFSLCERAGSKIENNHKVLDNTLKVQKTLKDMHRALLDAVMTAGSGAISKEVRCAIPNLLMPGFLSSVFFRLILVKFSSFSEERTVPTNPFTKEEVKNLFDQFRQATNLLFDSVNIAADVFSLTLGHKGLVGACVRYGIWMEQDLLSTLVWRK